MIPHEFRFTNRNKEYLPCDIVPLTRIPDCSRMRIEDCRGPDISLLKRLLCDREGERELRAQPDEDGAEERERDHKFHVYGTKDRKLVRLLDNFPSE